ncbi:MAG: protein translocase subunit SecF [Deltaproteobacteria bacterium]|nr:protein translocase subunit SecF [Deltaproteobacteria bacterium]MBW1928964.1 protein translocase subunit SecF [Deltaproteobacteria bacterium]MBW2024507.1 protein translocase subunit SecF [Deltaproteobacteria bacterium]MBW2125146.1 protein translocase subunit SecF [Deltaproteobacteria bacterium]RLB23204.1 MAG: protein translocase subunit SecF [Deltaproteobacteria bacterium]
MEFIKPGINIDFIGKRNIAFFISGALIVATFLLLLWRGGPNYGVDFTGGVLIQVKLAHKHSPGEIKKALVPIQLQDSIIQEFGEKGQAEYLIRVRKTDINLTGLSDKVRAALIAVFGQGVEIRRVEMVGPKVGRDLRQKALFAIFYAILFIAIYISGRFELKWLMSIIMAVSLSVVVYVASSFGVSVTWLILIALAVTLGLCWFLKLRYALGAIFALIHDVTITVGAFSLTDREISLAIIAAFLTIVGYSLNDTIIVFDRIRENVKRFKRRPFVEVMNQSINETLSRTVLTSSTTLFVVLALFVLGGGVIHDFAFAMLVGIVVGTYSSIYVASPILLIWEGKSTGKPSRK